MSHYRPGRNAGDLIPLIKRPCDRQISHCHGTDRPEGLICHIADKALSVCGNPGNPVVGELLAGYAVEIHRGEPSVFTEREVRDSYTDGDGNLYITVSWLTIENGFQHFYP